MLFKLSFAVTYTNGDTATVHTRPATEVAFERKFDRTLASVFTSGLSMTAAQAAKDGTATDEDRAALTAWFSENMRTEWTYFLAWHAARTPVEFDAWLDTIDEIGWSFVGTADPTSPAAPGI